MPPCVGLAMMPIQLNLSPILADSIRTYFSTIIHRLSFNLFFWIHCNTITHFLFFWTQMSCGILSWDHHYTATLGTSFTTMVGGSGRETPHCIVDNNFVWNLQFKIWVHPCLDYTLMDYSRLDYSWLDYRHLDYLWHLDYRRLDYFRLQGRSDYKDIWTIAVWTIAVWTILDYRDVWTTRTFGLPPIGLLRQTD